MSNEERAAERSGELLHDFGDGAGAVPGHRHGNGGGWVADTAQVDATAYVGPMAQVYGEARVFGEAQVSGEAQVYGVMRSDGYCFIAVPCADGRNRVIAGCRYFTRAEALAHWGPAHNHHAETTDILHFFISRGQL